MRQSRRASLAEAICNTAIGYVTAWVASLAFFRLMHITMTLHDLWWYTWFMTVISVVRGYYVRRMWNAEWWKVLFQRAPAQCERHLS